ncbi:glycosyl transferase family 1, partial [Pseudomonas sp. ATCC 13867]
GLVVPPSDPQAFRQAMRWCWENPEAAAEMGRQAEVRYRELFTADAMGRVWADLYRNLLDEKAEKEILLPDGRSG